MVFKKPYAFFIKYFRLINLILVCLFVYMDYKLNILRGVINSLYLGNLTNYGSLAQYIGFRFYFLIFLIIFIISLILLLFIKKKKPFYDYLYAIIYLVLVFIYSLSTSNLFFTLNETIVEQTSLKLYSDISFLIIIPSLYFIFKYVLIVIGFNLKKFNFTKDINDIKAEEKDSEEVEIIFDKNTYKYKRGIRRWFRELKYYFLENRFFISVIVGIIILVIAVTILSFNIFNNKKYRVAQTFNAGGFSYKINKVYETKYSLNYRKIKDKYKYVVVDFDVRNLQSESSSIDFKRVRILYGNDYVYANNYFNKFFYDIGTPYDNNVLKSNIYYNFVFIFEVPDTYKSNNYKLMFYDRISYNKDETVGSYKEVSVSASKLDSKREEKEIKLNANLLFDKKSYGTSNLTVFNYELLNNYIYDKDGKKVVVRDKDINKVLLVLDYKLSIDSSKNISKYFSNDYEFFDKFSSITYVINGQTQTSNNIKVVDIVNDKVMLSVPYEVMNAENIKYSLEFRNYKFSFVLK